MVISFLFNIYIANIVINAVNVSYIIIIIMGIFGFIWVSSNIYFFSRKLYIKIVKMDRLMIIIGLLLYVFIVGFIQGVLNSESSYQTGGILILVGFLLLRITYYAQSDKRKVGLLSYLISDIELVGSIKFDKFIEFVNEAENNSVKPFEIKHYTNEKGKKENKRLNLSKKYEISGTSIVIEASDGSDKYIFSVEVELSNNNKGMFHINKKPESLIKFWKTDRMTIEFEINKENKIRNIKPKDKSRSNEQYNRHNVIGSLKRDFTNAV
ncbi:hypothetical protein C2G38_2136240 [Gigaspora rosea]|uniref:Uncharacterized protein n=1 Tax=Gigaspora rosea TaxID=44941 RepID=A0A397W7K3_9GLOM|nr:hypothetical protein C2G38_2136240 [Gigaspora rosea]